MAEAVANMQQASGQVAGGESMQGASASMQAAAQNLESAAQAMSQAMSGSPGGSPGESQGESSGPPSSGSSVAGMSSSGGGSGGAKGAGDPLPDQGGGAIEGEVLGDAWRGADGALSGGEDQERAAQYTPYYRRAMTEYMQRVAKERREWQR